MGNQKNLFSLFLKFSAGTWARAVIKFFTIPITTRLIIPDEFGKATMFTLALSFILQLSMLGADQAFVRKFHEVKEKNRSTLLWNSLLSPIGILVLLNLAILLFWQDIALLLFDNQDFTAVLILVGTCVIAPIDELAKNVVRMSNRAIAYSTLNAIQPAVSVGVLISYAIYVDASFYAVIIGVFIARFITAAIAVILEHDLWFNSFDIVIDDIKEMLFYGVPFVPTFLFMWILQAMDKIALRTYASFEEVGLYAAAFKIVGALKLLKSGFQNFWIPVAMENYEKNDNAKLFFEEMALKVIPISITIGCGFVLLKDWIILLLGTDYHSASILIPLLIFVPISSMIREVTGKGIDFKKKTYWYMLVTGLAAAVNLLGNYLLVPIFSSKGAALSTAISYIVYFSVTGYISFKLYEVNYHLGKLASSVGLLFIVALIITFQNKLNMDGNYTTLAPLIVIVCITIFYYESIQETISQGIILLKKTFK